MKFINDLTAILDDGSLLHIHDDGSVEFFGGKNWKKGFTKMKCETKQQAIEIWSEVNNIIKQTKTIFI